MEMCIDRSSVKEVARRASPKDERRKLTKLWDALEMELGNLDASSLVDASGYALECHPDAKAYLNAVEQEDGIIMLDISIEGYVLVHIEQLPEFLQDDVKRIFSLLPESEVVA